MNHTTRHLTRLTGPAATILGLVFLTAGQAAAMRPEPGPPDPNGVYEGSATQSVLRATESSVSVLQWVLFAVVVIISLLIGAALTHVVQRRHAPLAN